MSAPYVALTYALNCLTSSSFAVYVQLATTRLPSFATSALTSSGVMSLFRIETWTVPAAALVAGPVLPTPVLAAGLVVAAPDGVHAAASMTAETASAGSLESRGSPVLRSMTVLLLAPFGATTATLRTWRTRGP